MVQTVTCPQITMVTWTCIQVPVRKCSCYLLVKNGKRQIKLGKIQELQYGIEWNMYDRVNLSLEYYNKKTTDLLFEVPTSLITGFDSRWENLGALKNDGFELELNSKNISNKNFTWTSTST